MTSFHLIRPLSGNALKLIAAALMLCDHVGMMLFPELEILRVIGRLAFPIFAFMIAEGAAHTKNKARYLLTLSAMALLLIAVYYIYSQELLLSIFVTFSLSVLMIYPLTAFKNALFSKEAGLLIKLLLGFLTLLSILTVYALNQQFTVEYGFFGCMTPVFATLFRSPRENCPKWLRLLDRNAVHVLLAGAGLLLVAMTRPQIQYYSLLALPLLLLYSGQRGKARMKYFFYIFYPAHLLLLELISMLF